MNVFSGDEPAHPLAAALAERLRSAQGARILEIGTGSGRNRRALAAAGFRVESYDAPPPDAKFDAAISTHALLHGTRESVVATVGAIAAALKPEAPLYATFASLLDSRYGEGLEIAEHTFAPAHGDETGVAHAYFDENALRQMLHPLFDIESLEERVVDAIVGKWAHRQPPSGSVHFFLIARKRPIDA